LWFFANFHFREPVIVSIFHCYSKWQVYSPFNCHGRLISSCGQASRALRGIR
jgi:hypothetical protein